MKALNPIIIKQIEDATDNNMHTGALAILAAVMGNNNMVVWLEWIDECHELAGKMTQDLLEDRALVSKQVMEQAEATYSNFNDIYAAF